MSVSILGRRVSGMKKQRCSGFRRLIVATQGAGSPSIAISRAFVEVSAGTRRTIARPKGDRLLSAKLPVPLPVACGSGVLSPHYPDVLALREAKQVALPLRQGPMRRHLSASGGIGPTRQNASFPGQLLFVGCWNTMPREVRAKGLAARVLNRRPCQPTW